MARPRSTCPLSRWSMAAVVAICIVSPLRLWAGEPATAPADDPQARALYDRMIAALREARTLSYQATYQWAFDRRDLGLAGFYKAWLGKPNYFRIEAYPCRELYGTLVGDGRNLWVFWPAGRPAFSADEPESEELRRKQYITKPAPIGGHSIGHEIVRIGGTAILDPSIFHGYTDSLQPYVSGVTRVGAEHVGDLECDVIEVSILDGQRTWELWLARQDNLPRKITEVVRVTETIVRREEWADVKLNEPIAGELFTWQPPPGWREWSEPDPAAKLLQPGWRAPDFELLCADGRRRRLSDYKDNIVWLVFWRYG